ncbi:MAG: NAD-dependent epimerase/dehydratase family protein [Saprospiraceae bacterium]|nr:NAD-dependent epimerase/dehydratase family protein [Saprospiraceae bacterium]
MNDIINTRKLDEILTTPSQGLLDDLKKIKGDFVVLGAAGKMGPSLTVLLKNGLSRTGRTNKVSAVSRFSDSKTQADLEAAGIETFAGDLLDPAFVTTLPPAENVIFMAGQKFGTAGNESSTWAMNAYLPGLVCEKYRTSNIVAFSTGNVYPLMPITTQGATEETRPGPIGEYAQSCLGRERIFEFFSQKNGTPVLIYRLNYALDLRYGVLNDIAQKIWKSQPIDLSMGHVNIIWQGDANEFAIRSLLHCKAPAQHLNITGLEVQEVEKLAGIIGKHLNLEPIFINKPQPTALISDASKSSNYFGRPSISVETMCRWTAEWIKKGGKQLNKPTHFQQRDGKF